MCRAMVYLGERTVLSSFLYHAENSLVQQAYQPTMSNLLNLGGCGLSIWDENLYLKDKPLIYRTLSLANYNENLYEFSKQTQAASCLIHIRGLPYFDKKGYIINNVHPFFSSILDTNFVFAHNGYLSNFNQIRVKLYKNISEKFLNHIEGTSDTEVIYALLLTLLERNCVPPYSKEQVIEQLHCCFEIISDIYVKADLRSHAPMNFFISAPNYLIASRYVINYGHGYTDEYELGATEKFYSLWFTIGDKFQRKGDTYQMLGEERQNSIIIASEPLDRDITTWVEVPEYSFITAEQDAGSGQINLNFYQIDI